MARSFDNVTFLDEKTVYAEETVDIGADTVIAPFVLLYGRCKIGKNCYIGAFTELHDTVVGDGSVLRSVFAESAEVGKNCSVGPFACLRPHTVVGNDCRVGDFVEIKNSILADGVKAAHLAYVGDSTVGEKTNVGCGTVFANFDGVDKHACHVGKNVFIGANTNLIAPVSVGDGTFIAAGSTVTESVPCDSFVIARSHQITKTKKK